MDYAGVRRAILYRNPPLVDDEGYELDSEDGDVRLEDAEMAAAELNPYANLRLEGEFFAAVQPQLGEGAVTN